MRPSRRHDGWRSTRWAGARDAMVSGSAKKALGYPFGFDLFHRFTNVRQHDGARKANTEGFLVAEDNGHVPLRAETLESLQLASLELRTQNLQRMGNAVHPRRDLIWILAAPLFEF